MFKDVCSKRNFLFCGFKQFHARNLSVKTDLLENFGTKHFGNPTYDNVFKHMLSISKGSPQSVIISFLNTFVPAFRDKTITEVTEQTPAIPAIRTRAKEKQTFMDLHVKSQDGNRYIVEMQAQRHVMFDERALFYACGTFSRQLSQHELENTAWYTHLKPVIALQILDYDTNRIRGIDSTVPDRLMDIVAEHPLPKDQFIKHFVFSDKSGQCIDYLQLIQVELPRADKIKILFPPNAQFTIMDWWLSILSHAQLYTTEIVEKWYDKGNGSMPKSIYDALMRLDVKDWDPKMISEYVETLSDRDAFATTLAVERNEGLEEGLKKGLKEGVEKGLKKGLKEGEKKTINKLIAKLKLEKILDTEIAKLLDISLQEVQDKSAKDSDV